MLTKLAREWLQEVQLSLERALYESDVLQLGDALSTHGAELPPPPEWLLPCHPPTKYDQEHRTPHCLLSTLQSVDNTTDLDYIAYLPSHAHLVALALSEYVSRSALVLPETSRLELFGWMGVAGKDYKAAWKEGKGKAQIAHTLATCIGTFVANAVRSLFLLNC